VSGDVKFRPEVIRMGKFLESELKALGAVVRMVPLGKQPGEEVDLPPVILAQVGNDSSKKTILCYGHYDVQPVCPSLHLFILLFIDIGATRRNEKTGGTLIRSL
jgi:Cys-Gly metallodipeptidase DUG1